MENKTHLDAWVQTGCPGVSTSLQKKQAQGGHMLTDSALDLCDATAPLIHQASCCNPPLAPGGLGSRMFQQLGKVAPGILCGAQ